MHARPRAAQVEAAGLVWIGPPAAAIAAMGDKSAAKQRMRAAGVPCVPGCDGRDADGQPLDDAALRAAAAELGLPLLVKAAAGGGGRGMRAVRRAGELDEALVAARTEARNAFGSDLLLLERLVENARHVEVQILADRHGRVVHLGERDCSVQRRHQKVIEEAPCPVVTPALRAELGAAACAAARAVDYVGAGTVEFLLGADGRFYFLEMNTRLQVEHPVTEAVTGVDLVDLQLAVAAGLPLGFDQDAVRIEGHAIELRLCAEDPAQGHLPQPGPYVRWEPPRAARTDHGLLPRGEISAAYDPMVAKIIVHGATRDIARRKALRALDDTVFFGTTTNRDQLSAVLASPTFAAGEATTGFLDAHPRLGTPPAPGPRDQALAVALWQACCGSGAGFRTSHHAPWTVALDLDGARLEAQVEPGAVTVAGRRFAVAVDCGPDGRPRGPRGAVRVDGLRLPVQHHEEGGRLWVRVGAVALCLARWDPIRAAAAAEAVADGRVRMPMAGTVLAVTVQVGDRVAAGAVVARAEAMKLETPLKAEVDGVVVEVLAEAGAALGAGATVLRIEEDA